MLASYGEEYASIAKLFSDGWTHTTVAWENCDFKTPGNNTSWVEFFILGGKPEQVSIGAPAANIGRFPGVVMVNVFVAMKKGKPEALRLADLAGKLFNVTSIAGVIFGLPEINTIGQSGEAFQVNVSIPFTRDSLV